MQWHSIEWSGVFHEADRQAGEEDSDVPHLYDDIIESIIRRRRPHTRGPWRSHTENVAYFCRSARREMPLRKYNAWSLCTFQKKFGQMLSSHRSSKHVGLREHWHGSDVQPSYCEWIWFVRDYRTDRATTPGPFEFRYTAPGTVYTWWIRGYTGNEPTHAKADAAIKELKLRLGTVLLHEWKAPKRTFVACPWNRSRTETVEEALFAEEILTSRQAAIRDAESAYFENSGSLDAYDRLFDPSG